MGGRRGLGGSLFDTGSERAVKWNEREMNTQIGNLHPELWGDDGETVWFEIACRSSPCRKKETKKREK